MALNTFKCNCLTPLHFKGLKVCLTFAVQQPLPFLVLFSCSHSEATHMQSDTEILNYSSFC